MAEDESGVRSAVSAYFMAHGLSVEEASDCAGAEAAVRENLPDIVIVDHQLPDGTALDLLPRLAALEPEMPVLVMTGHGTIDLAVRAMQLGAAHFLTKPVAMPALLAVVERLLEQQRLRRRQAAGTPRGSRTDLDPFLGTSAGIRSLAEEARRALRSSSPVLITGETGSGKGVLARWLHANGARRSESFVDLNCVGFARELLDSELFGHERGAFTGAVASKPGLLEVAHRGSVFLDEVGDMDLAVQGKLLKAIEEQRIRRVGDVRDRKIDVRILAATHRDLPAWVGEGKFREDLYYRLSVLELRLPALRDRLEDLPALARDILGRLAQELGRAPVSLGPDALAALESYGWPGNLREMRNVLERAVLRAGSGTLSRADLGLDPSPALRAGSRPSEVLTLAEMERRQILLALEVEDGHVERAAQRLGVPRSTLYQKLKALGIAAGS